MVFVVIKIITQELEIESNLKQRLEFICEFCHIKPTIINGSIRKIDKTNLSYIEPHKIIVKDKIFGIKKMINIKTKEKMITKLICNHLCYFVKLDFCTCADKEDNTFICNCLPFNKSSCGIPIALAISKISHSFEQLLCLTISKKF